MKLLKLPLYFWCNVFGEIREMPQWVNASLFLVLWAFLGKNRDICDMALGRLADRWYFLGIVHDLIKKGFTRKKEASSYMQMVFIVCFLSVYHNIVTCSQQKLKDFLFFICLVDNHISPYFLMLVWWHKSIYEINYSHFFSRGWLTWCLTMV